MQVITLSIQLQKSDCPGIALFSPADLRKIIFDWYKIGTLNLNFCHSPYETRTHSVQSIIGATDNLRDLYLFAFIE